MTCVAVITPSTHQHKDDLRAPTLGRADVLSRCRTVFVTQNAKAIVSMPSPLELLPNPATYKVALVRNEGVNARMYCYGSGCLIRSRNILYAETQ
jgi:hypothetical protein